jgi:hypothetical protein
MQRSNILRLVRCDWPWKLVPWITLLFVFLPAVPDKLVWGAYAWVGTCVGMRGCFRSNRFLSSLPFDGRSIFLARFTTVMALLWCPAIAATVASFVLHAWNGSAAGFELLTHAGFYTAMFLLAYAIRIEMFHVSEAVAVLVLFMFFVFGMAGVLLELLPVAPTVIVETTVIALLMIRVWQTVPRSFRIVSRPSPARSENCLRFLPAWNPTRLPLLRLVWSWYKVWIFPVIIFTSGRHSALVFTAIVMPSVWGMFPGNNRWLRALPISPRRLLRMFILPVLAAVVVGNYASLWWPGTSTVQTRIVSAAVAVGFTLVQCIFWAWFQRRPSVTSVLVQVILTVALWSVWLAMRDRSFLPVDQWVAALVRASSHVPDFLFLIIAIAILTLLYAVLEWVFAGSEYRSTSAFRQEKS